MSNVLETIFLILTEYQGACKQIPGRRWRNKNGKACEQAALVQVLKLKVVELAWPIGDND